MGSAGSACRVLFLNPLSTFQYARCQSKRTVAAEFPTAAAKSENRPSAFTVPCASEYTCRICRP